jgi:hypothetical protein
MHQSSRGETIALILAVSSGQVKGAGTQTDETPASGDRRRRGRSTQSALSGPSASAALVARKVALFGTIWHGFGGSSTPTLNLRNDLRQIQKRAGTHAPAPRTKTVAGRVLGRPPCGRMGTFVTFPRSAVGSFVAFTRTAMGSFVAFSRTSLGPFSFVAAATSLLNRLLRPANTILLDWRPDIRATSR